jgi:hypothetical protein
VFTCHNLLNCENIIEKCSQTLDYILKNWKNNYIEFLNN